LAEGAEDGVGVDAEDVGAVFLRRESFALLASPSAMERRICPGPW
jgi:hypothetical protein